MRKILFGLVLSLCLAGSAEAQQPLQANLDPSLYAPGVTYYDAGSGQNFYYDSATSQFMVFLTGTAGYAYGAEAHLLSLINNWRAQLGRGPVGWDANLAYYASLNSSIHQPGTSGGGMQCWAGVADLVSAFHMWVASPPHAAILLNATSAIGASLCPSGSTLNAR